MNKDDVISKLGWFTQMESIPPLSDEFKKEQIIFFENIIHFLQDNGFTTKEILKKGEKPTDNTEIKIGDLTEEGLKFYPWPSSLPPWRSKGRISAQPSIMPLMRPDVLISRPLCRHISKTFPSVYKIRHISVVVPHIVVCMPAKQAGSR